MVNSSTLKADFKLRMESWKCVNPRHKRSECTICEDNCPTRALIVDRNGPRLSKSKCTGCGICCSLCHTEVFSWGGADYSEFLDVLKALRKGGERLFISCERAEPSREDAPRWSVKCLGGVDYAHLVGIARAGFKSVSPLGISLCGSCPSKKGAVIFREQADRALRLLKSVGLTLEVDRSALGLSFDKAREDEMRSSDDEPGLYSRREFFNSFRDRLSLLWSDEADPLGSTGKAALRRFDPARRVFVVSVIRELSGGRDGDVSDDIALLSLPVVRGRCDICQMCALFCPTGALYAEASGGSVGIRLKPHRCTECGLCVTACPQGAMGLEFAPGVRPLITDELPLLVERKMRCCRECEADFIPKGEEDRLCKRCATEKALESLFDNGPYEAVSGLPLERHF